MFGGSMPSLADIAAVTGNNGNNNGGWGDGNGWWVLIILFALFGGWGRGGYGNDNGSNGGGNMNGYIPYFLNGVWGNGALTRADLCQDMNFQELQNGIRSIASSLPTSFANLNATICNQQYDTARMFNGLENTVQNGFNSSNVVALQNQNALQTQIAQCCCDAKSLFAQAEYNRATDTCAITNAINQAAQSIIQNDNCNYRQLHDEQIALQMQGYKETIANLRGALDKCDNQNLVTSAVQSAVNQIRPTPVPAWPVPNPFAYSNFGGCGCCNNNGCNF